MKQKTRMSFDDRQKLIIARVRELFAHKGMEGATTKDLAHAAGVSEGLLFKHFPTKQAIFQAMLDSLEKDLPDEIKKVLELPPSTGTLVAIVHTMATMLLTRRREEMDDMARMYLRSLAGDGDFARALFRKPYETLIPRLEESIKAATASGDMVDSPVPARRRALFTDRLIFELMTEHLPPEPVVGYGASREKLARDAVLFLLRAMGLKDEAIRRHYPGRIASRKPAAMNNSD